MSTTHVHGSEELLLSAFYTTQSNLPTQYYKMASFTEQQQNGIFQVL